MCFELFNFNSRISEFTAKTNPLLIPDSHRNLRYLLSRENLNLEFLAWCTYVSITSDVLNRLQQNKVLQIWQALRHLLNLKTNWYP